MPPCAYLSKSSTLKHTHSRRRVAEKQMSRDLSDEDLAELYRWVDTVKLSRPKRNIARDFSDGGMHNLKEKETIYSRAMLQGLNEQWFIEFFGCLFFCIARVTDLRGSLVGVGVYLLAQLLSHAALQPFSVLCAEIVNSFFPKYVELHNYPAVSRLHLCFELAVSILFDFCPNNTIRRFFAVCKL